MFIECYVPRALPWVKVLQKPMRPVRAKALIINAFALTGRLDYIYPYTQGGALPFIHIFCSLKSLEFCIFVR